MYDELIVIIIGIIIGAIIIFLILREFLCWYWKINRLVALMEVQNNLFDSKINKIITLMEEQNKLIFRIAKESFSLSQGIISSTENNQIIEDNNSTVSKPVIKNDNLEETNNESTISYNKRCRECGTVYSGRFSCPKCYSTLLYEEKNQSIDTNISLKVITEPNSGN
jgi:uncharacterized membrane-anchored protein YhcB (DUF1043 family)